MLKSKYKNTNQRRQIKCKRRLGKHFEEIIMENVLHVESYAVTVARKIIGIKCTKRMALY